MVTLSDHCNNEKLEKMAEKATNFSGKGEWFNYQATKYGSSKRRIPLR